MCADNIKTQIGAPVLTQSELFGLVGWELKNSRRMGIQTYWASKPGIKLRMGQCAKNSTSSDETKKHKKCEYAKCPRCKD